MDLSIINNINADELAKIPGIGEQHAQTIIEYRDKMGGFKNWDQLKQIPGFPEQAIDKLKNEGGGMAEKAEKFMDL